MKIGVLGGSFNPPHRGHLQAALIAASELRLNRVLLVPCALPAHKELDGDPGPQRRIALTQALAACAPGLVDVDLCEFERPGPSWTADTLADLHRRYHGAQLHLIIGADQALALPGWYRVEEVIAQASICAVPRDGFSGEAVHAALTGLGANFRMLSHVPDGFASTDVRRRREQRVSWRELVPEPVAVLIDAWALYAPKPSV